MKAKAASAKICCFKEISRKIVLIKTTSGAIYCRRAFLMATGVGFCVEERTASKLAGYTDCQCVAEA
jgi:hypothetical protein